MDRPQRRTLQTINNKNVLVVALVVTVVLRFAGSYTPRAATAFAVNLFLPAARAGGEAGCQQKDY